MKKNILLTTLTIVYVAGLVSAVIILTTKQPEKPSTSSVDSLVALTPLGKKNAESIGVIKMDAPISFNSESRELFMTQPKGASFWLEQLTYAETNENIKALIIRVNSPGGTVGASQELHAAVKRVQETGKPVITSIADMSASGGYYATVSSDRIFANPGSLVGSIGVILGGVEFSDLLSKVGIKYQAITSGKNKDLLSPYKKMTPEQHTFLQTMVDNTYNQFLTAVAEGRKKDKEVIRPLADGSVFTGEQAVQNGLIDALGSFYDVVKYTKETYDLTEAEVEFINPMKSQFSFTDLITILAPNSSPKINLIETESPFGYSPVLYLYQF